MVEGVSYLDDLLNEMINEDPGYQIEREPSQASITVQSENFRGDFDYLEALLSDIGVPDDNRAVGQMSPKSASGDSSSRMATTSLDLESTLKDLEETFSKGSMTMDDFLTKPSSPAGTMTSSARGPAPREVVHHHPPRKHTQEKPERPTEDYMDILDELVAMKPSASVRKPETSSPASMMYRPVDSTLRTSNGMEHHYDSPEIQVRAASPQDSRSPSPSPVPSPAPIPSGMEESPDDLLDQMIRAFTNQPAPESIKPQARGSVILASATSPPTERKHTKGVQVLPSVVHDVKLKSSPVFGTPPPMSPLVEHLQNSPSLTRSSRLTPVAITIATPSRTPPMRTTDVRPSSPSPMSNPDLDPLANANNMDDLLEQMINSFVDTHALSIPAPTSPAPAPASAASPTRRSVSMATSPLLSPTTQQPTTPRMATNNDVYLDQILSNEHLDMDAVLSVPKANAKKGGPEWLAYYSEFEKDLHEKLGVGNHGETFRHFVWRGKQVTAKKWNASLASAQTISGMAHTGVASAPAPGLLIAEASSLVSLKHPNLIPLRGLCLESGIYTLCDYVPGANLHGFVMNGSLRMEQDSTATIVRLARAIAEAMAYLHTCGVMHRSFHPKNIIVDSDMKVRIRDYGFSALKDEIFRMQRATNPRFPQYDAQYLAPELMRAGPYDGKVDVFSFGVMLWELFAGQSLKDGFSVMKDLPSCPFTLQKLIRVCVSPDPAVRPTFDVVVKVLSQPLSVLTQFVRPEAPPVQEAPKPAVFGAIAEPSEDDKERDREKIRKIFTVIQDLTRTPSDAAQMKGAMAVENLAQKDSNIQYIVTLGYVPQIVDIFRSKYPQVQEAITRIVATLLKNAQFSTSFIDFRGLEPLFQFLIGSDDGLKLVAAKALTVAAYTVISATQKAVLERGLMTSLISLLSAENEFVRVQIAWLIGQLLSNGPEELTNAFVKGGGVELLEKMVMTHGSPAAELRGLGALTPLYAVPIVRANAASKQTILKKIGTLLASNQQPVRAQALGAAANLSAEPACAAILMSQGAASSLVGFLSSPQTKQIKTALVMIQNLIVDSNHLFELKRVGAQQKLVPFLEGSEDPELKQLAQRIYSALA